MYIEPVLSEEKGRRKHKILRWKRSGQSAVEGRMGKIESRKKRENCKTKKNWKMCKNKVVNQYECPVVI